jgi:hypothetical protein
MIELILISCISLAMICITSLITYEILRIVWIGLPKLTLAPRLRTLIIIAPIFLTHIAAIWMYAGAFFLVENWAHVGKLAAVGREAGWNYQTFLDCLYFSSVTYTSLGFGDVVATGNLRMMMAAEVLNGLVMIGWTVSFTYLSMEKFWLLPHTKQKYSHDSDHL